MIYRVHCDVLVPHDIEFEPIGDDLVQIRTLSTREVLGEKLTVSRWISKLEDARSYWRQLVQFGYKAADAAEL
jgi:hypothetical protein